MKKLALFLALGSVTIAAPMTGALAATTPCETMLKDLRAAEGTAKLDEATKTKVKDLEAKGIERCNADDDTRADEFFTQAMKAMGK